MRGDLNRPADRIDESRERVLVRPERSGDSAAIHRLHVSSFPSDAEGRLVDRLRVAGRLSVSLVAESKGTIVGHVAFSPVSVASRPPGAGLAPVAVSEAHRRRGIAAELIRMGLEACKTCGFGWAVVLGEPKYYSRFEFRPASEFGLSDEYGGGSAFQAVELIPESLPVGGGLVRYSPEFEEVS